MADLAAFLRARLDEDEAAARANIGSGPGWQHGLGDAEGDGPMWPDYQTFDGENLSAAYAYLEHFRPLRQLREIEAKRAILAEHEPHPVPQGPLKDKLACGSETDWNDPWYACEWPCPTVLNLAAVYSDHPDYDSAWRPAGQ